MSTDDRSGGAAPKAATGASLGEALVSAFTERLERTKRGEDPLPSPYDSEDMLESPIERDLFYAIAPHISPAAILVAQESGSTPFGVFRFDFVLSDGHRRVVIECDGKEFHDDWRDEWRDALTLGYGIADEVIRFPGKLLARRASDCALFLLRWFPWMASERGAVAIKHLASPEAHDSDFDSGAEMLRYDFNVEHDDGVDDGDEHPRWISSIIRRRRRDDPAPNPMWRHLFAYAKNHPLCSFDALIVQDGADFRARTGRTSF